MHSAPLALEERPLGRPIAVDAPTNDLAIVGFGHKLERHGPEHDLPRIEASGSTTVARK
jgi:hypothetical protein